MEQDQHSIYFQQYIKILLLLLSEQPEGAIDILSKNNSLIENFYSFIKQQHLQFIIFSTFNKEVLQSIFPPHLLEQMEALFLKQQARQQMITTQLLLLSQILQDAGQEFILLKGPYLAEQYFGGKDRRAFSDIDLLIRRKSLKKIDQILHNIGYQRKSSILFNKNLTAYFTHAFDYGKSNVTVDLHWALSTHPSYQIDYQDLWQCKQNFLLNNQPLLVLSAEYDVLLNLLSALRDLERGALRLKPFVDLYFILRKVEGKIDWKLFFEKREREKTLSISVNILVLFLNLFDCQDQFKELAKALNQQKILPKLLSLESSYSFFLSGSGATKNKIWASSIYECSSIYAGFWWLTSLPFRLAVHRISQYRQRLERLKNASLPKNSND